MTIRLLTVNLKACQEISWDILKIVPSQHPLCRGVTHIIPYWNENERTNELRSEWVRKREGSQNVYMLVCCFNTFGVVKVVFYVLRRRCHRSILQCDVVLTNVFLCMCTCVSISTHLYTFMYYIYVMAARFTRAYTIRCFRTHSLSFFEYFFIQNIMQASRANKYGSVWRLCIWAIVCKQYKYDVIFDGFFPSASKLEPKWMPSSPLFCPVFLSINSHIRLFSSCFFSHFFYYRCRRCHCRHHQHNCFSPPKSFHKCVLLPFSLWLNFAFTFRHAHIPDISIWGWYWANTV